MGILFKRIGDSVQKNWGFFWIEIGGKLQKHWGFFSKELGILLGLFLVHFGFNLLLIVLQFLELWELLEVVAGIAHNVACLGTVDNDRLKVLQRIHSSCSKPFVEIDGAVNQALLECWIYCLSFWF